MKKTVFYAILSALFLIPISSASAQRTQSKKTVKASADLAEVCPSIRQIANDVFYKNNKPIRASSAFAAPVIGYNKVMTLAYQAGRKGPLGKKADMYDANGGYITKLRGYPCRSDHCGGRVVSSLGTAAARAKAVKNGGSPEGYIQLSNQLCIRIPDIGACYNVKKRGPCTGVVK